MDYLYVNSPQKWGGYIPLYSLYRVYTGESLLFRIPPAIHHDPSQSLNASISAINVNQDTKERKKKGQTNARQCELFFVAFRPGNKHSEHKC